MENSADPAPVILWKKAKSVMEKDKGESIPGINECMLAEVH